MKVYNERGEFIPRSERGITKQEKQDRNIIIFCAIAFVSLLVLAYLFNVQIYL